MLRPIRTNRFNRKLFILPGIFVLLIIYIIIALLLPMPKVTAKYENLTLEPKHLSSISWPNVDQSAVGALGYGVLATDGDQKSHPIASMAKTMLAISVIEEKPLKLGEQGPVLTMTQDDVDLFNEYMAKNGSVVPVNEGEKITEYQLLQGLLISSGDNIADTLAIWTFGSVEKYLEHANNQASEWGLKETHFADTSGFSPETVSSAKDLITLGEKVLSNPVLAEIVNQSEAELPVVGKVKNYNAILGENGIIGIKTGTTDEAGGCLLFAANQAISGKEVKIIGAILGAIDRARALQSTNLFLERNNNSFGLETVIKKGSIVGVYETPWGKKINAIAKEDLQVMIVDGMKLLPNTKLEEINSPKNKGDVVGEITVEGGNTVVKTQIVLEEKFSKPPFYWKLVHP